MGTFFTDLFPDGVSFSDWFPSFHLTDVLDILAVAFLIYILLSWVRKTRGWTLLRGITIVLVVWLIAYLLQLNMLEWFFQRAFSFGVLALIVLFQPELRRALERLGTNNVFGKLFAVSGANKVDERTAEAITRAMTSMSETKTGALICVEQQVPLGEYEQTGIPLNADVSTQLLLNIFVKNTPLHDGAVIIRQNRIVAATCYLPLSDDSSISKELGTRHRAAVGLSEVSDAKIFIVSEETGAMSMAFRSRLYRNIDAEFIKKQLLGEDAEKQEEPQAPAEPSRKRHLFSRRESQGEPRQEPGREPLPESRKEAPRS